MGVPIVIPERPQPSSPQEYRKVAWHIAAVYRARMGASAQEGAEMADMLGVPREAIIAAREDKPANPGQVCMSEIRDEDLIVDLFDPYPRADGIHVETCMGVRVYHIPTGIIVESSRERSQLQNKAVCLELLMDELASLEH